MVRAAGQGHGRNDAATTDPQPRARCSSYPHAGVFSIRIFSLLRGLWMFVLVRVVGVRGYDGRIGQRRRNNGPAASRGPQQGRVVCRSPLTRWPCYILVTIDYATYL